MPIVSEPTSSFIPNDLLANFQNRLDYLNSALLSGPGTTRDEIDRARFRVIGTDQNDTVTLIPAGGAPGFPENELRPDIARITYSGPPLNDYTVRGGDGDDVIQSTVPERQETVLGEDGNDYIWGNTGEDILDGGNGNDQLIGGAGSDYLDGGNGNDILEASDGNDNDLLVGGNGNDVLLGRSGDDFLNGSRDNDRLEAGSGNDILIGGSGDDELIGGSGRDTFIFEDGRTGIDYIKDLSSQDTILFDNMPGFNLTSTPWGTQIAFNNGTLIQVEGGVSVSTVNSVIDVV